MSPAMLRMRTNERRDSRALASASNGARRTQYVPRTESGRLLPKGVAIKVSQALDPYSEGVVATAAETSKDTAQSWKLERRAPNSASLMALGRAFDEVGMLVAEEMDLGRFFNRDERIQQELEKLSLEETPEGQWARWFLRKVKAGGFS